MRQAVSATLSVWGERRLGYSTLNDSREVLLDEGWLMPGLKEDSVVEEKEVADGEQEQPEAAVARSPSTPRDVRCLTQTKGDGAQPEAATPSSPQTSESPSARSVYSTNGPAPEGGASDKRRGSLGAPPVQCCSLGSTAPQWVPDSHAPACMKCGCRFSFTRRRHHCRACGKVFCVVCCDLRFRLSHLGGKEGRVCVTCHSTLINRTIRKEQKKVWFADSVLPRNEVSSANTTPTHGDSKQTHTPTASQVESTHLSEKLNSPCLEREEVVNSPKQNAAKLLPHKGLPPILTSTGVKGDYTVEERRTESSLLEELEQGLTEPLVFVLNANLLAMVKIVSYVNRRCWCVMSRGMHAVGQPEVVVLLQCLPEEKSFPTDIFSHFIQIYWDAQTAGKLLNHLSHSSAARGFLGGSEHAGFLYVRPTFQSLDGLPLPPQPFLFGLLVLRAELPWARAFPLRLLLRLGAEYRFYPCPLFSVRFREPLFGQVRNSIMRLLVDFRFYRYTLPVVTGLMVDLEARSTCITIPKTRHTELLKALNRSIEKVLAMAACFNERADSHLICVQTADGEYQTQAISIHSQPRRVTGSCFFVFSGSLKPSSGYLAKSSIVEDGLMVQVTMETMLELRRALRDMRDFTLTCGKLHQSDRQEYVHIQWQDEEPCFNKGIISPIDGKSMESITCVKTCQRLEYRANGKVIRWTEVFFLQRDKQSNGLSRDANQKRVTERLARAFCLTLCQSLSLLKEDGMSKLGLRITLDGLKMEFLAGSNGQRLPEPYQASVKQALTAVVQSASQHHEHTSLQLELIFYILEDIS